MNCLHAVSTRREQTRVHAHRAPADAAPVWQQRMRISLTAGDRALANDDMVVSNDEAGKLAAALALPNIAGTYRHVS